MPSTLSTGASRAPGSSSSSLPTTSRAPGETKPTAAAEDKSTPSSTKNDSTKTSKDKAKSEIKSPPQIGNDAAAARGPVPVRSMPASDKLPKPHKGTSRTEPPRNPGELPKKEDAKAAKSEAPSKASSKPGSAAPSSKAPSTKSAAPPSARRPSAVARPSALAPIQEQQPRGPAGVSSEMRRARVVAEEVAAAAPRASPAAGKSSAPPASTKPGPSAPSASVSKAGVRSSAAGGGRSSATGGAASMTGQFTALPASTKPGPSAPGASSASKPGGKSSALPASAKPGPAAPGAVSASKVGGRSTAGGSSVAIKSAYRDPEDLRRAQRQTEYSQLSEAEQAEQDVWAKQKADEFAPCPYGFLWEREPVHPGYRCTGGTHYMSDSIIAEGVPKLYALAGAHAGLKNADREPLPEEQVPEGMRGPVEPVGRDEQGRPVYFTGPAQPLGQIDPAVLVNLMNAGMLQ